MWPMQAFLDREQLWTTLQQRARIGKGKNLVAVPYVGTGAAKLLPLGAGDVLLCALTEGNCRNGSVNPDELYALRKRGVRLFIRADLHAKVYLLGTRLIVGSANLSVNSRDALDEAGLHTSDKSVVKRARTWFAERMAEPVTPAWLAYCKKIHRPAKAPGRERARKNASSLPRARRVWLLRAEYWDAFPESELAAVESASRVAARRLEDHKQYEVDHIRFTGKSRFLDLIQQGDVLIAVCDNKVYPHGRVLGIKRTKTPNQGLATHIFYEAPKNPETIGWSSFRRRCAKFGLGLATNVVAREIRDLLHQNRLLALVSPDRL